MEGEGGQKKNPFVITEINTSRGEMQMPRVVNYLTEEVTAFYQGDNSEEF